MTDDPSRSRFKQLRPQATQGVFWSVVQASGTRGISFLVFIFLARLLTPEDFGAVAMSAVAITLIDTISEQGFAVAIVQQKNLKREHLTSLFWISIGLSVLGAAVLIFLAPWISHVFKTPSLLSIIPFLAAVLPLNALVTVHNGLFRREFRFRELSTNTMWAAGLGGICGVVYALIGANVYALVAQQIVTSAVYAALCWLRSTWRPKLEFSWRHAYELWTYSSYIFWVGFLEFVSKRADDFLIGLYLGASSLGVYSVAYRSMQVFIQLIAKSSIHPSLSMYARLRDQPDELRKALYASIRTSAFFAIPLSICLSMLSPLLVPLLFGARFAASGPILRILALVGIAQTLSYFHYSIYLSVNRPDLRLKIFVLHTLLNVIGFYLAVLQGSTSLVATVYTLRAYLMLPLDIFVLRNLIGISVSRYLSALLKPAIAGSLMAISIYGVLQFSLEPVPSLILALCVASVTYLLFLSLTLPNFGKAIHKNLTRAFDEIFGTR